MITLFYHNDITSDDVMPTGSYHAMKDEGIFLATKINVIGCDFGSAPGLHIDSKGVVSDLL